MDTATASVPLDFDSHIRRSHTRQPRKISATAKVSPDENRELQDAAHEEGKALGEWAREVLLRAARKQEVNPAFTEVVAMRLLLNTVLSKLACGEQMTKEAFNAQMQTIRTAKHKAAEEVMQQYTMTGKTR